MKTNKGRVAALAGGLALLLGALLPTQPAQAHGAPNDPISRGTACAPDNERYGDSPACRAAQAAGPVGGLDAWDNARRKDVDGRHRSVVPDGQLCGAGLDEFSGLNLARADWPATFMTADTVFDFSFLATIPHAGGFKLYITNDGYDPTKPLRWSDLEPEPFVEVDDPPLVDSAYRFAGRLPAGKNGRHVIFTIWENTTLPDTYYFCSDVVFRSGASGRPSTGEPSPAPTTIGAGAPPVAAPTGGGAPAGG
ncbi:lytic polysaccharide monooxygenase, partial [Streptomyces sp. NPDC048629]|uniref:lytic polysaccharide monooxygenase auxiliary activity family 9 protein n=1 Tax=Streptomyces sp. NPDC048629 TaxID=3154824 RepID=UPI0034289F79